MQRIVVHPFSDLGSFNGPVSKEGYSKFKYGSHMHSYLYGQQLATALAEWIKQNVKASEKVILCGAPYKHIPVASTALADHACMFLKNEFPFLSISTFKIDREQSYDVDYGALNADAREELINADKFTCDVNKLNGNHVIFIDDVVITGAHERNMERMVKELGIKANVAYAYLAALEGGCCPSIEADLNYAHVKADASNIVSFLNETEVVYGGVTLNTRLVKFLLKLPQTTFIQALDVLTIKNRMELRRMAYANDYHTNANYQTNIGYLTSIL